MSLNIPLAVEVMANIEIARAWATDPTVRPGHDQAFWFVDWAKVEPGWRYRSDLPTCGTSMCAGGWALHLSGIKMVIRPGMGSAVCTEDGSFIQEAAAEVLGMVPTLSQADSLRAMDHHGRPEDVDPRWDYDDEMPHAFGLTNSVDDLYRLFAEWADENYEEADLRADTLARVSQLLMESVAPLTT